MKQQATKKYDSLWGCWTWRLPNGKLHREGGHAVEWNGKKCWYLNGKEYTKKEHKQIMRGKKLNQIING